MAGFRNIFSRQSTEDAVTTVNVNSADSKSAESGNASPENAVNEKGAVDTENPVVPKVKSEGPVFEAPDENTQRGVADMEAMTQTWSRRSLISVFCWYALLPHFYMILYTNLLLHSIWLLYFINAFQSSVLSNLIPYLTSDWDSHSLLNVIYVVADAITAACYVPLGKIMDIWGRAEGFAFMAFCSTIGLIMMAACNNLPTFCAAYVCQLRSSGRCLANKYNDRCSTLSVSVV